MITAKSMTIAAGALALAGAIAFAAWFWLTPKWPEFPAQNGGVPQVVVELQSTLEKERDYAYHLGDLVELSVFVKEAPGTAVDPRTLSVGGDYELASRPQIDSKKLDDGTTVYRIKLALQAFKVKPKHTLTGTIGYRARDERKQLDIPEQSFYWSNTYDGRDKIKEGDDPRVPAYAVILRHAVPLALSSLVFLALCLVAVRNYLLSRPKPTPDLVRRRATYLIGKVKSGRASKEDYLELDGLVRDRFGVGPVPASQLDKKILPHNVVAFLTLNAPAIYRQDALNAEEAKELSALADKLLSGW